MRSGNAGSASVCVVNDALRGTRDIETFTCRSSRRLNHRSNFPIIIASFRSGFGWGRARRLSQAVRATGETTMRFEMLDVAIAGLGEAPATAADMLFELGMMYASGRSVSPDLVIAHKWFNLAAAKGNPEAARLRREVADEMSDQEFGGAQRAARDWLMAHPEPAVVAPQLRMAA
jgi:hypothetical protein